MKKVQNILIWFNFINFTHLYSSLFIFIHPGYYCTYGVDRAQPDDLSPSLINGTCQLPGGYTGVGGVCPAGHFCPQGSGMPIACEAGSYANITGLSVCWDCPEGYYCPEGKQDVKVYWWVCFVNQFAIFFQPPIGGRLNTLFCFLRVLPGAVSTRHMWPWYVQDDVYTSVSRSPRGHGSVAPDKRHCRQWMSSLFCGFLPNPF